MAKLDQEKIDELRNYLVGTCKGETDASETLDIPDAVIFEYIVAAEIECCACCGWWFHSHEVSEVDSDLYCEDCIW